MTLSVVIGLSESVCTMDAQNAHRVAHKTAQTRDLITPFKWEQMDPPPPRTALIWRQVIFTSSYIKEVPGRQAI